MDYSITGADSTVASLPQSLSGFAIQVRAATPADLARAAGRLSLERVPSIRYELPQDLSLDAVDEEMFAVFHVSPDAGWTELREFLSRTRESLTLGLYNFATEHVKEELINAVSADGRAFDLVLGDCRHRSCAHR